MSTTQGHRIVGVDRHQDGHLWYAPSTGAYWRDEIDGDWWGCTPNGLVAALSNHSVVVLDDGTITVSPSILCGNGEGGLTWHGYLRAGVWEDC